MAQSSNVKQMNQLSQILHKSVDEDQKLDSDFDFSLLRDVEAFDSKNSMRAKSVDRDFTDGAVSPSTNNTSFHNVSRSHSEESIRSRVSSQ